MSKNKKAKNSQSRNQIKGLIRLLGYMFKHYKIQTLFVIVFICLSSFGMVIGTMYSKELIDGIIIPNIGKNNSNFINELVSLILKMAVVYGGAVICTYIYEIFMIYVAQGTLKKLRDDVFIHMESLTTVTVNIKYTKHYPSCQMTILFFILCIGIRKKKIWFRGGRVILLFFILKEGFLL